ncbi:Elongation factor Ts, mitochondrial [Dispira parvispora]|uniref:Elongation factor Ts, mitochondrial n=1 Tax=Dispira parvispora TaxID=1520584 RepID=A0A9W8ASA2_9FUNG|nr:Elongation factor Ts, mitochondrial [Dispira parvispora]
MSTILGQLTPRRLPISRLAGANLAIWRTNVGFTTQRLHTSAIRFAEAPFKVNVKLVARLRKELQVPMNKAREALTQCNNDYDKAYSWLEQDALKSGAESAAKLADRSTQSGLVASVAFGEGNTPAKVGTRGGMIVLRCETDFVARNELFRNLATRIAASAALGQHDSTTSQLATPEIVPVSVEQLLGQPLVNLAEEPAQSSETSSATVDAGMMDVIGKLKENTVLHQASMFIPRTLPEEGWHPLVGVANHGGESPYTGKFGALLAMKYRMASASATQHEKAAASEAMATLATKLARMVVGFDPKYTDKNQARADNCADDQSTLLELPLLGHTDTIRAVMQGMQKELGVEIKVTGFLRYAV